MVILFKETDSTIFPPPPQTTRKITRIFPPRIQTRYSPLYPTTHQYPQNTPERNISHLKVAPISLVGKPIWQLRARIAAFRSRICTLVQSQILLAEIWKLKYLLKSLLIIWKWKSKIKTKAMTRSEPNIVISSCTILVLKRSYRRKYFTAIKDIITVTRALA